MIACASLIIMPIRSRFNNFIDVVLLNYFFLVIISFGVIFIKSMCMKFKKKSSIVLKSMSLKKYNFICSFSTLVAPIGLLMLAYDRIFIREIDYSIGLRAARYQWLNAEIAGSIWSKIGNLLVPFSYCMLFMGLFHWESCTKLKKFFTIIIGFGVQIGLAMLNGGRSNILISIVFAFVVCIIRKMKNKTFMPSIPLNKTLIMLFGVFLFYYASILFYAFSENNIDYLKKVVYMLGGEVKTEYLLNNNKFINTIILIFLYLFHGVYYSGAVILYPSESISLSQNVSLRVFLYALSRLQIIEYNIEPPKFDIGAGTFISLPGILLHDYGYGGFICVTLILGLLFGIAICLLSKSQNISNLKLIYCIVVFIIIMMSPITLSIGLIYFNFMFFALLVMDLISSLIYGKSSWLDLKN